MKDQNPSRKPVGEAKTPLEPLTLTRETLLYLLDDAAVRGLNMGSLYQDQRHTVAWWHETRANIPRWVMEEAEEEGRIQAPEASKTPASPRAEPSPPILIIPSSTTGV